jgi:hypothetical protein
VPEVLELAQFLQHDRVTQMDVGRRRVDAQLHAQGLALRQLALELSPRKGFDCIAEQVSGLFWGRLQGGAMLRSPTGRAWQTMLARTKGFTGVQSRRRPGTES